MVIAYILSSFPTLSETFILEELLQLRREQVEVVVFSLKNPRSILLSDIIAGESELCVCYSPYFFGLKLWLENIRLLFHSPKLYIKLLVIVFTRLALQPAELLKTLSIFPKVIYFSSIARKKNCQHVHAHFMNVPTMAAVLMSRILNAPYSCTAHGSDIFYYPPRDMRKRISAASPCITVSSYNYAYLTRKFSLENGSIQVIHCGIDLNKFPHRYRTLKAGQPVHILTVARLEFVKGVDILLDACRWMVEHNFNFALSIVGDGSERVALQRQKRHLNLDSHVEFLGSLSHEKVIEKYSAADIFALSSRSEGIPVSVMEAMACGLPVVVPNITGLSEIVSNGKTGLVFHPEDSMSLAQSIIGLASNPKSYEYFSKTSRAKIENEFNIAKSVEQLIKIWA